MWEHTLSTISMNAWASCPERFSTVLTSLASEKIVAIRATCSSTVRVLLINCFQAGAFDRSTVRQKGYLRTESQASLVGKLTWCTPRNIFGLLFQVKKSLASRQVLARPVTHLSFASSIPQRGSSALVDIPIDPVVSEGAGVHDPREAFHLGPCGTDCGIYSQFVNHDLRSKKSERARGQEAYGTNEKCSWMYNQHSRQEYPFWKFASTRSHHPYLGGQDENRSFPRHVYLFLWVRVIYLVIWVE